MNRYTSQYFLKSPFLLGLAVLACAVGGCTDKFNEWNINPHQATEEMLQYDNLSTGSIFVQMQKNVFPIAQHPEFGDEVYQTVQNLAGDIFSGYMGASGLWYSNVNNTTYALLPEWYNRGFERGFVGVMPAWNSIKQKTEVESPHVYAIATVVKVAAMHRVADMYGPLPYLDFGSGSLSNTYDGLDQIYYSFIDELTEAVDLLTDYHEKNPGARALADYDFIFGGDVVRWIKFGNTLKLRLAMRMAYADPNAAQQGAESAVNHPVGVFTNASDVAQLNQTSGNSYNHPLYIICFNFEDVRMGATMDSYLNGYNDPRVNAYFLSATDGAYRGIRNGISITNKVTYSEGPFSRLNVEQSSPVIWMGPAEAYFLRAEGALRGWNMGGTAQDLYETGVKTSFSFLGVGGADAYLNDDTSTPASYTDPQNGGNNSTALSNITIKWEDADSFERKLERIVTQKWIAGYPDGQEAWSEFRRTGYPRIFPVVQNNSGGLISTTTQVRRLPFPSTEYQNNAAGVSHGVALLGGADHGGTKLWWDKK